MRRLGLGVTILNYRYRLFYYQPRATHILLAFLAWMSTYKCVSKYITRLPNPNTCRSSRLFLLGYHISTKLKLNNIVYIQYIYHILLLEINLRRSQESSHTNLYFPGVKRMLASSTKSDNTVPKFLPMSSSK